MLNLAEVESLRGLSRDGRLLFGTRMVRMFAYGLLSVVLALYLVEVVGEEHVGAVLGAILIFLFSRVSPAVEVADRPAISLESRFGLHRSQKTVFRLSALFALDAFAGGMVIQSFLSLWFHQRYGVDEALIGAIFFGANILAGLSALVAARIAGRFGLINTMVFTHIPSNALLMLVPLMLNLALAIAMLLIRFSISQMDVPTRQSYTMSVVAPDERSAAAGITTIVRSVGTAQSQQLTGQLFATSLLSWPFFLAGGLKIVYDLMLYRSFRALKPPEETAN